MLNRIPVFLLVCFVFCFLSAFEFLIYTFQFPTHSCPILIQHYDPLFITEHRMHSNYGFQCSTLSDYPHTPLYLVLTTELISFIQAAFYQFQLCLHIFHFIHIEPRILDKRTPSSWKGTISFNLKLINFFIRFFKNRKWTCLNHENLLILILL